LVANFADKQFEYGPNLDVIPKVNKAYEEAQEEDGKNKDHIKTGHRNFLRDAVFFLYTYNREADAAQWFKYLTDHYPNKSLIDGKPDSLPGKVSLDEFALNRIQEEMNEPGRDKALMVLQGLERTAFKSLAVGEDDRFAGYRNLSAKLWIWYNDKIKGDERTKIRVGLPPLSEIRQEILDRLLNGEISPGLAAQLRTKLNLPAPTNAPPAQPITNSVPAAAASK
jgi:hypothetical protein